MSDSRHFPDKRIDIWTFNTNFSDDFFLNKFINQALSADEIASLNGIKSHAKRKKFIFTRAMLRLLLSYYVPLIRASDWAFERDAYGKPFVDKRFAVSINFNISHSGDYIVIVFSELQFLGVDIEKINFDKSKRIRLISEGCFTDFEQQKMFIGSHINYVTTFYQIWTLKESYLKASGFGLSLPMNSFDLSSVIGKFNFSEHIERINIQGRNITFFQCQLEQYIIALTTDCCDPEIKMYDFFSFISIENKDAFIR